jgi:hypothetical protein
MKQYLTKVLKEIKAVSDYDQILLEGRRILEGSNEFLACFNSSSTRSAYNNYFDLYQKVMSSFKNGEHKGIRLVTNVDKDSIDVVKEFLKIACVHRSLHFYL